MQISKRVLGSASCAISLALGVSACAHQKTISPTALSAAEAPVRAAEEAGAPKIPSAALYLKLAHDELAEVKTMADKGDARVTSILARAQADAELALAMAQRNAAETEARTLLEKVKAVKGQ